MTLKTQTGRSMVEMLGTLAIIGVLSIGGIAGYSYGMNKYRANQTINDIMLMSIDVITQSSQHKEPSLAEWGTQTSQGYTFSSARDPEDDTKYGITIEGVPSRICKMIGDALKSTLEIYVSDEGYNVSSNIKDPCDLSDKNTMEFYFELTPPECKTDADCGEGNYCDTDMGWCFSGDKPIISVTRPFCMGGENDPGDSQCCGSINGSPGYELKHGTDCTLSDGSTGMCYYGKCLTKGCTYTENKCRGEKEYCASPNTSCEEAFPEGKTGSCIKADFTVHNINGKTYYISKWPMSWWDGDAACRAIGRDGMIDMTDFIANWNGETMLGWNDIKLTPLGDALYHQIFNGWPDGNIWSSNLKNNCQAYVSKIYGSVDSLERNIAGYSSGYVICK